ncbi:hypothetical protein [Dietzia sp.]|uniref:hypothetical protein n=1 Tax=Dietzia sp. TaxID=1871616 RepID=UPI002FD8910A
MDFGSAAGPELEFITGSADLGGDFFGNVGDLFGVIDYFTGTDFQEALAKGFMK